VLGIGKRLFAAHPVAGHAEGGHAAGRAHVGVSPAQMSADALSLPGGADIAQGAFLFTRRDAA
jgi:hypothetical protein